MNLELYIILNQNEILLSSWHVHALRYSTRHPSCKEAHNSFTSSFCPDRLPPASCDCRSSPCLCGRRWRRWRRAGAAGLVSQQESETYTHGSQSIAFQLVSKSAANALVVGSLTVARMDTDACRGGGYDSETESKINGQVSEHQLMHNGQAM